MIFLFSLNYARSKFTVVIFRGSLSSRILKIANKKIKKIKENKVIIQRREEKIRQ